MSVTKDSSRSAVNFRALEHDRQRAGGHVVAVDVQLHAERTADVARDDAHVLLGDAQCRL